MESAMSKTSLSVHAALALVDGLNLAGGLTLLPDDPTNPPQPSPIDPVIREALYWGLIWAPHPDPWRLAMNLDVALGPISNPGPLAALNPQPLPPIAARLAAALVARAELIADASGPDAAASYVQRMIDDLCPPPRVIKLSPPKGPWPPSEPRPILGLTVSPSDLVLFARTLKSAARSVAHEQLAGALEAGAMKAAEQGVGELAGA
jgi:hypothetical protein